MSTVKTNNIQVGQSGTATNNFTLYQPATPDGTVRIANGNSGSTTDVISLTSAGVLRFNSGYGSVAAAYGCRAWVNFDGTTNVGGFCTIRASGNVTTVADNGVGDYTVNFTTAMPDTNFAVTGTCVGGSAANVPASFHSSGINTAYTKTTSSVRFRVNITSTGAASDATEVDIAIFR